MQSSSSTRHRSSHRNARRTHSPCCETSTALATGLQPWSVRCVECQHELRDGAAFCSACGGRQQLAVETPDAVARYRELVAKLVGETGHDASAQTQLETVRVRSSISLATHAKLLAELAPAAPPPASLGLSIDVSTLKHLAVGARGLVRWRIENHGQLAFETVTLAVTLSGTTLPVVETSTVFPSRPIVASIAILPETPGVHELAGELRTRDLMGETSSYRFGVHVVIAAEGPKVNIVNIDQSNARVVDNSRSTFGAGDAGGLLGEGDWQPVPVIAVGAPAQRGVAASTNSQRVEFAISTETATYQVTTKLAAGDISTVYGGHVRGTQSPVVLKIADQSSDNDLLQHETRVLGLLLATPDKTAHHFVPPLDQFRTSDGRLGTVFDHVEGFDLTTVRDRCRRRGEPGLPARHIVWVLRRSLAALGWAHKQGILHGNIDPVHILIRPHDHMLWLVDWCWAVVNPATTGQGFKALNEIYSAPEVRERKSPTPAADLYSLGKVAIHLAGGDPATKTLPDMDARLARFIKYLCVESRGGRAQDAWEQYVALDKVRGLIWGKHEFVQLEL